MFAAGAFRVRRFLGASSWAGWEDLVCLRGARFSDASAASAFLAVLFFAGFSAAGSAAVSFVFGMGSYLLNCNRINK